MPTRVEPNTEDYVMPSTEAVLGGTIALLTGYPIQGCARARAVMKDRIVSNLARLSQDPHLSEAFRRLLRRLWLEWLSASGQQPDRLQAINSPLH